MVKSVEFPLDGTGYIYNHPEEPFKPMSYRYEHGFGPEMKFDKKAYDADMKEYRKQHRKWLKTKDDFINPCYKNLAGKKFTFCQDRVNVIYGPNGSGKTTILKAIAGAALCSDGLSSLGEPLDISGLGEKITADSIKKYITKVKENESTVDWDGTPIYYDNSENTVNRRHSELGDWAKVGSFVTSFEEEITYFFARDSLSMGYNKMYILNNILRRASKPVSLKAFLENYVKRSNINSCWRDCYKKQIEYFSKLPNFDVEAPLTFLFDEPDKSFDVETSWTLYTKVFPLLVEKFGCQVIAISHNPLVLTKNIMENPRYNMISLDQKYTEDMKKLFEGVSF